MCWRVGLIWLLHTLLPLPQARAYASMCARALSATPWLCDCRPHAHPLKLWCPHQHNTYHSTPTHREQNRLADRLATMSMAIDTALYTILRRDDRDVHALRIVARAAHISKKSVSE